MKELKEYKGYKVFRVDIIRVDIFGRQTVYPAYLVGYKDFLLSGCYKTIKDAHNDIDDVIKRVERGWR